MARITEAAQAYSFSRRALVLGGIQARLRWCWPGG